ncbi:imelysin family protein [Zobellia galactanivorans]|uniref:Iron-regulated protein A n=1 Tax=Zobellia galactanivorans (strain DSM 12802 / CCUG 47099 / CIP 106680 / NCIMB 13871 / Dsij) TaxID=63186 RepID=G0LAM0_ZOBGA|nr:imelysin family protein [Zobellia galactanivorans]CAZ95421.1 Iron-regulated protein A [Zobellia galactanivorans]
MIKRILKLYVLSVFALVILACSSDDNSTPGDGGEELLVRADVMENYADIVQANYAQALADAKALQTAIETFVADPTEVNFEASKTAWLASRESYGTTEAFRFANGPIDSGDTEDLEGLLNSWPMDEAYVDYVEGDDTAGLINDDGATFEITKENLVVKNGEGDTEENVSVGYHAIEFLLWGQDNTDPSEKLSGQRPYTDFVDDGTAANQDRRRVYLQVIAELLVDNLEEVVDAWSTSYRATFLALSEEEALSNMLTSIAELSSSELAVERMAVALNKQDQEDEHSCFSDNTHRDIRLNLQGIKNVYTGSYGAVDGLSLADLISEADGDLASELDALLAAAETAVGATAIPFDLAIAQGVTGTEGAKVQQAVVALTDFGNKLLEAKAPLGIN